MTAFDTAFARLQVSVLWACGRSEEWPTRVAAAIAAALDFATPAPARLLTVEPGTQGAGATARHRRLFGRFTDLLCAASRDTDSGRQPPPLTEQLLIGAITGAVTGHLLARCSTALPALVPELALLPYVGRRRPWPADDARGGSGGEPSLLP